jgi:hypothetical protein
MAAVRFQIGTTPNPNAIRVGLSEPVFEKPATYLKAGGGAPSDPLLIKLLGLPGVTQVFAMSGFITVTKEAGADWGDLEPKVAKILMGHFA